jgi:hypothetical protein
MVSDLRLRHSEASRAESEVIVREPEGAAASRFTVSEVSRSDYRAQLGWPDWMDVFLTRIGEASAVEDDWDSYGGTPPTRAAVVKVALLRDYIRNSPWVIPSSDGGLRCEWSNDHYGLELVIEADGELSAYFINKLSGRSTGPVVDDDMIQKWTWLASEGR